MCQVFRARSDRSEDGQLRLLPSTLYSILSLARYFRLSTPCPPRTISHPPDPGSRGIVVPGPSLAYIPPACGAGGVRIRRHSPNRRLVLPWPSHATCWAQNPNSPRVRVRSHKLSPQYCTVLPRVAWIDPSRAAHLRALVPAQLPRLTTARNTPGLCSMTAIFHAPYWHATAMCSAACPVVATMVPSRVLMPKFGPQRWLQSFGCRF